MNVMNVASVSLSEPMVQRLGWTLVHTLWQGVAIAAALAVVLRLLRAAPASVRYAASCAAMSMMVFVAVFTFTRIPVPVAAAAAAGQTRPLARPVTLGAMPQALPIVAPPTLPPPAGAPAKTSKIQILRIVVLAWVVGVALMSLWHAGGWLWLRRMRRGARIEQWSVVIDRLSARLNLCGRAVALIETVRIDVPAVVGVLRPVILVPASVLSGLTPQQVEAILAHELAHVRRHDYLVNLFQVAVETLLFYHPATWWISSQIRQERENCCDDIASSLCGDRSTYAGALAALEERRGMLPPRLAPAATGANLTARVRRVLRLPPARRRPSRIRSLAAAIVALSCVALPLFVAAQQKTEPAAPAATTTMSGTVTITGKLSTAAPEPTPILPEDLKEVVEDYRTGPGDLLGVSIADLVAPGAETVKQARVSETGAISLPLVGSIKVAGLTAPEVEAAVQKAYRDKGLMPNAQVSVTVVEAKQRLVNVIGQVDRPGQYPILKPGYRLIDALAQAGAHAENLNALRVVRNENGKQRSIEIPLDKLMAGNAGVNVVMRPGDTIVAKVTPKNFVNIVIGRHALFHDGKPIDWPEVHKLFDGLTEAQRRSSVLEIAAASPDVTVERYFKVTAQMAELVEQYKLAYLSETGIQPTTEPAAEAAGAPSHPPATQSSIQPEPAATMHARVPQTLQNDSEYLKLHAEREKQAMVVERLKGFGPNHERLRAAQSALDDLNRRIAEYERVAPEQQAASRPTTAPSSSVDPAIRTLLQQRVAQEAIVSQLSPYGSNYPPLVGSRAGLEDIDRRIAEYARAHPNERVLIAAELNATSHAGDVAPDPPDEATLVKIASADETMRAYLHTRNSLRTMLERMSRSYGDRHPSMQNLKEEMDKQSRRIAEYASAYITAFPATTQP